MKNLTEIFFYLTELTYKFARIAADVFKAFINLNFSISFDAARLFNFFDFFIDSALFFAKFFYTSFR